MCVCVCVCGVCVLVRERAYVQVRVCVRVRARVCPRVRLRACVPMCALLHECMFVCVCVYVRKCMDASARLCIMRACARDDACACVCVRVRVACASLTTHEVVLAHGEQAHALQHLGVGAAGVDEGQEGLRRHPRRQPLDLAVAQQAGRVQVPGEMGGGGGVKQDRIRRGDISLASFSHSTIFIFSYSRGIQKK